MNHARDLVWQDLKRPWITTGIKKSSKRKQRLYEKCLKKRKLPKLMSIKIIKNYQYIQYFQFILEKVIFPDEL